MEIGIAPGNLPTCSMCLGAILHWASRARGVSWSAHKEHDARDQQGKSGKEGELKGQEARIQEIR